MRMHRTGKFRRTAPLCLLHPASLMFHRIIKLQLTTGYFWTVYWIWLLNWRKLVSSVRIRGRHYGLYGNSKRQGDFWWRLKCRSSPPITEKLLTVLHQSIFFPDAVSIELSFRTMLRKLTLTQLIYALAVVRMLHLEKLTCVVLGPRLRTPSAMRSAHPGHLKPAKTRTSKPENNRGLFQKHFVGLPISGTLPIFITMPIRQVYNLEDEYLLFRSSTSFLPRYRAPGTKAIKEEKSTAKPALHLDPWAKENCVEDHPYPRCNGSLEPYWSLATEFYYHRPAWIPAYWQAFVFCSRLADYVWW